MERIKNYIHRLRYQFRSNYLLDNFTLKIKDKEITKLFGDARCESFHRICYPIISVNFLYFIYRLYQFIFVANTPLIRLLSVCLNLLFLIFWFIIKKRFPLARWGPMFNFVYLFF